MMRDCVTVYVKLSLLDASDIVMACNRVAFLDGIDGDVRMNLVRLANEVKSISDKAVFDFYHDSHI